MIAPTTAHWQAARRFLHAESGERRSAVQCGEAAAHLYEQLRPGLAPLIGTGGFDALFARSVNQVASGLVGLAPCDLKIEPTATGGSTLFDYLAKQEPRVAAELATAVFAAFFALLTTFIGKTLTEKILLQVGFPITETHSKDSDQ